MQGWAGEASNDKRQTRGNPGTQSHGPTGACSHGSRAAEQEIEVPMRCSHCDRRPVEIDMTVLEGRQVTLRSCCTQVWLCDGKQIPLSGVLQLVPARKRRAVAA